nr:MAG TPA: hypothetical protein [Caudoviricetes sp.]
MRLMQKGYNKAIDDFEIWLKTEKHKAIDVQTGELLIARDGTWVDAFETFRKEYKPEIKSKVRRVLKKVCEVPGAVGQETLDILYEICSMIQNRREKDDKDGTGAVHKCETGNSRDRRPD